MAGDFQGASLVTPPLCAMGGSAGGFLVGPVGSDGSSRLVFVKDSRTGHAHIVDRGSIGVPAALALCGHRMDLRGSVHSWPVFGHAVAQLECVRCLRAVR